MLQTAQNPKSEKNQLNLIVHVGFALTGVVTTMMGAVLPMFTQRWSIDDAQAGYLFAAQNVGGLLTTLFVGEIIKRFGIKAALVAGFGLLATGVAGLNVSQFGFGIAAVFLYGLGLGIALPASNILIAELNRERRAAALNILNFIWCIGAVIGTPALSLLIARLNLWLPLGGLTFVLFGIGVILSQLTGCFETETQKNIQPTSSKTTDDSKIRFALYICAFAFLVVGIENSLSGWIASLVTRLDASQRSFASMYQAVFWVAMLFGRASAPKTLSRISEMQLLLLGVSIATLGMATILASVNFAMILLGIFISGLGLSTIFPTTIAIFSQVLGAQAGQKSNWLFASASFGSSLLPFLVGVVSSRVTNLRVGLSVALIAGVFATILQVQLRRLAQRNSEPH
ncbi:MAG: MFS transporter [Acidobacteriota bacterium]